MSNPLAHPEPEARQEPDLIPTGKIVGIGIGALVIFGLGIFGATLIWIYGSRGYLPQGPAPIPKEVGQPEIGNIFQRDFDQQTEAKDLRERQLRQLQTYGWTDRGRGLIHIPIDQSMGLILEGKRP